MLSFLTVNELPSSAVTLIIEAKPIPIRISDRNIKEMYYTNEAALGNTCV